MENNYGVIEVNDANGPRLETLHTVALQNGVIFIDGEITSPKAMDVIVQLSFIATHYEGNIRIILNSPGGEVTSGLLIYDALQAYADRIHIYVTGVAMSMGAVILAGGKVGHRHLLPHSKILIHEPLIQNGLGGSTSTVEKTAEHLLKTRDTLIDILKIHTKKTKKEIQKAISYDNEMTAEEAISFGLADDIVAFSDIHMV